jgi:Tfp pilus assembly protein PilF
MTEALERLLEQGDDNAGLRFALATRYFAAGQADRAEGHARAAIELDRGYSAAWRLLGQILVSAGLEDEAKSTFRQGIEIAEAKGDLQVAKEMRVFLKRLERPR